MYLHSVGALKRHYNINFLTELPRSPCGDLKAAVRPLHLRALSEFEARPSKRGQLTMPHSVDSPQKRLMSNLEYL